MAFLNVVFFSRFHFHFAIQIQSLALFQPPFHSYPLSIYIFSVLKIFESTERTYCRVCLCLCTVLSHLIISFYFPFFFECFAFCDISLFGTLSLSLHSTFWCLLVSFVCPSVYRENVSPVLFCRIGACICT